MFDSKINTQDDFNLDIFETTDYKLYKDGMKLIGLWPFESSTKKTLKRAFVLISMISVLISIQIRFVEELNQNIDIVLQSAGSEILSIGCIAKFVTTLRAEDSFRVLFIQIAKQWASITDETECKILADNVKLCHPLCTFYRVMAVFALSSYACLPSFGPVIMNILLPLNETRQKRIPAPAEYFVDEEKYFYILFSHGMILYMLVCVLYVTIDSMYSCIVHHTVGLVGIVTYRLQNIIDLDITSSPKNHTNNLEIRRRLRRAITLHKESIEFAENIEATYSLCFIIVMFVNLFSMVFTAACGIRTLHYDKVESFRWLMLYGSIIFHLFFNSNPGQNLFDKTSEIINTLYFTAWYDSGISTSNKRIIQIMMIRCLRPCQLTAGGLLVLNMFNFGAIVKTSFSYITMLLSVG
ncbi:odorant receptor 162 [Nasonia vitripennis]|uniref:Odorant receptor n=1 Tax=Nasonia vitripennis TaxID=7425 RepID=A0A7M6UWP0_NASVI|nr:odorant receptor 162 [Nasonia vitripennis]